MIPKTKLNDLVTKIAAHQAALNLSDEKFCARFARYLGSPKTWRDRLIGGDLSGITNQTAFIDRWTVKLTALATEIDGVTMPAVYLKDFAFAKQMTARLALLESQTTDRRCLVGLAVTGCGKSVWAGHALAEDPGNRVYILANESWREKRNIIAIRLCHKFGVDAGSSEADAVDAVRNALLQSPKTVFIDSAQEGGIALMKLIRDWIDGTRSRFVYLGYATEYDRMLRAKTGAIDEAKQFLGRSLKPIYDDYRDGLHVADLKVFLASSGIANGVGAALAKDILPAVRANGNLRFLEDALENAQAEADDQGSELSPDHVRAAVKELCPAGKEDSR